MPVIREKNVWTHADENFRKQISNLKTEAGVGDLRVLSVEAGLPPNRLYTLREYPCRMVLHEQRKLMMLFHKYGMTFDVTLGMGGALDGAVAR